MSFVPTVFQLYHFLFMTIYFYNFFHDECYHSWGVSSSNTYKASTRCAEDGEHSDLSGLFGALWNFCQWSHCRWLDQHS